MRSATMALLIALIPPACGKPAREAQDNPGVASGAQPAPAQPGKVDACKIVTQAEASALFGQPAARESGATVTDPSMVGECIWGHDSEAGSHQLQVRVWGSPQYYSPPQDEFTQPLDLGEKGYVRAHSASGVDIAWVQGGRVTEVSYFTVGGASFPKATDRVDAVTQLAKQAATKL